MFVVFPSRGIGAAALAAGLLLAGCSSESDVPPTVASAPGGGTQQNTDTGTGGDFPDVNTTPTQRPTSTIQDLAKAPTGLAAAPGGTQYGEALVGGPSSTAAPPPPPPPPEPPQEALAPIPEPGVQTDTSDGSASAPTEQAEAPAAVEPEPQPAVEPEAAAEPEPAPTDAESQGEGQTIQGTMSQPEPEPAPIVSAPEPAEPAAPTYDEQPAVPEPAPAAAIEAPQPEAPQAPQPAQMPPANYGSNQAAQVPEAYGVSTPQPNGQNYNSTQVAAAAPGPAPSQGQSGSSGEPVGLIYFRDGSAELGADDRRVIQQIAEIQRAYGGVVSVIGHASVGGASANDQANQRISEARATAVAEELMRQGVPLEAIRAGAAGDSQPLYSEAAANGEAGNRRVEVYLTAY